MTGDQHRAVASKILLSLKKMILPPDYRPVIEGAIVVAYHLGNAVFHDYQVSETDEHINIPSRSNLSKENLPNNARSAWHAFEALENLRIGYVRRFVPYNDEVLTTLKRAMNDLAAAQASRNFELREIF